MRSTPGVPGAGPPGRRAEYLRNRPKAVAIVRHFVEANKPIAANCHGPLLVIAAAGANGKTMTCYPDLEPDLRAAGAEFVNRDVVVDGSLVTVRGWPDNGPCDAVATSRDDVALLGFTSGTTGEPKATMHFHRDLLIIADGYAQEVLNVTPDDVFVGSPPLAFTFGLGGRPFSRLFRRDRDTSGKCIAGQHGADYRDL